MNSRGQLWSLDVVLAAVVFTLALGMVVSQSELHLFYDQQENKSLGLWNASVFTSNMLTSKPDVVVTSGASLRNLRCGPSKWAADNDLSWMENCLMDAGGTVTPSTFLNIPAGYSVSLSSPATNPLNLVGFSSNTTNGSQYSFSRSLLILPSSSGVKEYRQCMDGACPTAIVPVTLTLWEGS